MKQPRHRAETIRTRRKRARTISWSVVVYMVAIVLVKHYYGIDLNPL
jgi:hypothetical protein